MSSGGAVTRRVVIGGAAATAAATTCLHDGLNAQAPISVNALVTNSVLSGPLRNVLQDAGHCTIVDAPFQSTTDAIARLNAPGGTSRYDLMGSTFEFSEKAILGVPAGSERVLPLDLSLIPNHSAIVEGARNSIGRRGDKTYMIPYAFGFDSVLFNRDRVPENDAYTQSWGAIFEDKYAGRIAWYDVAVSMISAAALYLGNPTPYKMGKNDLDEVVRFLSLKKKNVRAYFQTGAQAVNLMLTGECSISYGALPIRAELALKGFNVGYAFPKEGVKSITNTVYIPKESKNPRIAHALINAMLGKEYASQLSKMSGYGSTSMYGPELLNAEERKLFGYGILDGTVKHVGEFFPELLGQWIEGWARVKSA